MERHRTAMALALAFVALTAGCGFLTGSESLTFAASSATASDSALSDTGYTEQSVEDHVVTRNFTVAGQTRSVEVTNQLARYDREADLGALGSARAAVFVAFASPKVEIAGQTFNPIAQMSEKEILGRFSSAYSGLSVGQQVDSQSVSTLGSTETLTKFEGTATFDGTDLDVYIHAVTVEHEGDIIVAIGIYPRALDGEADNVVTLVEGLEHGG